MVQPPFRSGLSATSAAPALDSRFRALIVAPLAMSFDPVRARLDRVRSVKVVAHAATLKSAYALAHEVRADVVLVALDATGTREEHDRAASRDGIPLVALAASVDSDSVVAAARLGATGLVEISDIASSLERALERVCAGEVWFDRRLIPRIIATFAQPMPTPALPPGEVVPRVLLSERELDVLRMLSEGLRNRQIGERLFISETTVRHHLTRIYARLGVKDRSELILYALTNGLVGGGAETPEHRNGPVTR